MPFILIKPTDSVHMLKLAKALHNENIKELGSEDKGTGVSCSSTL